jgi:hypothetical protein
MSSSRTSRAFRGSIESFDGTTVVIGVPGTSYSLRLATNDSLATAIGERVSGVIKATALRVHVATAGGLFIEPTSGEPRIVAGRIDSIDAASGECVVCSVVPMAVRLESPEDAATLRVGDLVNFHVRSGATWTADR